MSCVDIADHREKETERGQRAVSLDDIGDRLDLDRMDDEEEAAQEADGKGNGAVGLPEDGETKGEPEQAVEQKPCPHMDQEIGEMINKRIQAAQIVVYSKTEISEISKTPEAVAVKEFKPCLG